jgi:hypothetical protein
MPQGRFTREINIWHAENAKKFAESNFEDYCFISEYDAIFSKKYNTIEAAIRPLNNRQSSHLIDNLFTKDSSHFADAIDQAIVFASPDGKSVEIGPVSRNFSSIAQVSSPLSLSLKLNGYNVNQHDIAKTILEKTADSVFMQLDLVTGFCLTLKRDRANWVSPTHEKDVVKAVEAMPFPQHEYDHGPVALYQYGRSADGMPLLQFLAFYQVVEFYYPNYSDADARKRVRNILKDPNFHESREADIGYLLEVIQSKSGKYGGEKNQLKATISECVDAAGVIRFIDETTARSSFYKERTKKDRHTKINFAKDNNDLLTQIASRLYEIRCEIVHTKDIGDDVEGYRARLLPFTQEADQLEHDIALMQYVAQRVLIASSHAT